MQSMNNIHNLEPTDISSKKKKPIDFNHYKSNKSMEGFFPHEIIGLPQSWATEINEDWWKPLNWKPPSKKMNENVD